RFGMASERRQHSCAVRTLDAVSRLRAVKQSTNAAGPSSNPDEPVDNLNARESAPMRALHENFLPRRQHLNYMSTSQRGGQRQEAAKPPPLTALEGAAALGHREGKSFVHVPAILVRWVRLALRTRQHQQLRNRRCSLPRWKAYR